MTDNTSIAVVGGGVAGLATATALSGASFDVHLFESHQLLGGRAGSFHDARTGQWVDHCQHVAMGCCTHYLDFCRRTGIEQFFRRERTLHFFGPDAARVDLRGARWLPAPLHLAPFLTRLGYLTWSERRGVAATLLRLARLPVMDAVDGPTIGEWLELQRQSTQALERFWAPVLVSALSETLDRASLAAARKVFVEGFLAHHQAYELIVPTAPLSSLYDHHVGEYLLGQGTQLHRGCRVKRVEVAAGGRLQLQLAHGPSQDFDAVVMAVPWRQVPRILAPTIVAAIPRLEAASQIQAAPITSLHLWFDRSIMNLSHAILIERLAQWVFNRGPQELPPDGTRLHYYQVVISASRNLEGQDREEIVATILQELRAVWPAASAARLVKWQLLTQREAVFSVVPGLDERRPTQRTPVPGFFLAGDWTSTHWPATMEGAVRSGYLAAHALLESFHRPFGPPVADLRPSRLFRLLARGHRRGKRDSWHRQGG